MARPTSLETQRAFAESTISFCNSVLCCATYFSRTLLVSDTKCLKESIMITERRSSSNTSGNLNRATRLLGPFSSTTHRFSSTIRHGKAVAAIFGSVSSFQGPPSRVKRETFNPTLQLEDPQWHPASHSSRFQVYLYHLPLGTGRTTKSGHTPSKWALYTTA